MKGGISIIGLMSKSNKSELTMLYNLIKKHPYFIGERRSLYKQIVKYKNKQNHK